MDMKKLSDVIMDMARCQGAFAAGIATLETLKGGPPSTDLSYILPNAKSAISFAVAFDETLIEPYLTKKDHLSLEKCMFITNTLCSGISQERLSAMSQEERKLYEDI